MSALIIRYAAVGMESTVISVHSISVGFDTEDAACPDAETWAAIQFITEYANIAAPAIAAKNASAVPHTGTRSIPQAPDGTETAAMITAASPMTVPAMNITGEYPL